MFFFATLTSIIYLLWRAIFTLPFQSGIVAIIFGIMLLVSEITSALGTFELYYPKESFQQGRYDVAGDSQELVSGRG